MFFNFCVCRPGLIGPHSVTGEGNKEDWFNLLLSAILEIGLLPTSSFFTSSKLHLIPVDYVSKGVAAVSLRGSTDNGTCVCVCVHACVRACAFVCLCAYVCMCLCVVCMLYVCILSTYYLFHP